MQAVTRRQFLTLAAGSAAGLLLESCARRAPGQAGPCPRVTAVADPVVRIVDQSGLPIAPLPFSSPDPAYPILSLLYDSLLWLDDQERLIPWLATGYTKSADGLTYTFDLRDNVTWSDGQRLTVEDVVFSYQTLLSFPNSRFLLSGGLVGYRPENVSSVTAAGANSVELKLTKPAVTFLRNVAARVPIAPKHIWENYDVNTFKGSKDQRELLIGSGPFRLEPGTLKNGRARFTRRDDFFLGKPSIKALEFLPAGDPLSAVRKGDADSASVQTAQISPPSLSVFERDCDFGVLEARPDTVVQLYFNLTQAGPLGDVRFRRAVARGIDRVRMLRNVAGGRGQPGNPGLLPRGNPNRAEVEQYRYDPAAAKHQLEAAGYKSGKGGLRRGPDGKEVRFSVLASAEMASIVEIVQQSMKSLGIRLDVDPAVSGLEVLQRREKGDFDLIIASYQGLDQDADLLRLVYSSRGGPGGVFTGLRKPYGYANPEFDDLAERQLVTQDKGERQKLLASMQKIVADDLPVLPLIYPVNALVYRKKVFQRWGRAGRVEKSNLLIHPPAPLPA